MKILLLLFLTSCAPYVGYTHLSDPSRDNDGSDLVCAGVKLQKGLDISAGWCENLRNDWSGINIDVEYVWDD